MFRYEFKVTYNTDRSETYEIEAAQVSDAYYVLIESALEDADDNEGLIKIELVGITTYWVIDEDE